VNTSGVGCFGIKGYNNEIEGYCFFPKAWRRQERKEMPRKGTSKEKNEKSGHWPEAVRLGHRLKSTGTSDSNSTVHLNKFFLIGRIIGSERKLSVISEMRGFDV
jgi:hypothetical protein